MADFVFPLPDVGEFEAPNGLTYTHDGQKWRVKFIPGGAPVGKEGRPWLEISSFNTTYNGRTAWGPAWVYQPWWSCNSNCTYTWQYEIDLNGDGNWIDIADHPQKDELGYFSDGETQANLILLDKSQASPYPNALVRFRLTGELNNIESELSTPPVFAWRERSNTFDPVLYDDGTPVEPDYATKEDVEENTISPSKANSVTTGFRIKNDNKTLISTSTAGKLKLFHVVDPSEDEHAANRRYVDEALANFVPAWTPSAFMWEWGGNNDTREDPGTGKFQVSSDNKTKICFSATLANGQWIGNVFKSSNTYDGHKERIVLWHEQTSGKWKAWFDGLIIKYDGATDWWHMELDPASYGRITSWTSGLYYVTGGPF